MRVVQVNREARTYIGPWEWSDESVPSGDYMTLVDADAQGYTAEAFRPWVPSQVPAWALSSILDQRGKLAALEVAIEGLAEPTKNRVKWLFQRGDMFERDGDVVNGLGAAIGYSPAQVDKLFVEAFNYAQS